MSKAAVVPLRPGAVIDRKYRLVRRIGEGAMGAVWQAVNESTHGEVALKLIVRPERELRARLLCEAQACCAIRHKNVVQVYDVGETADGDPFLVMELLLGETLADMLARRRRFEPKEAAAIGRDVARALAAAHEKSIIHRDLKPANVFLHHAAGESGPIVKVLDFGVSKNLLGTGCAQTAVGATIGSPGYMSPEQALSSSSIDGRSDVWSLGVLLFEMLAGVRPFEGEPMEVIRRVVSGPIPGLSHRVRRVPPGLSELVMACLRREPADRPWPASEIATELDSFTATFVRGAPEIAGPADLDGERTRKIEPERDTVKLPERSTQPLGAPAISAAASRASDAEASRKEPRIGLDTLPASPANGLDHAGPLRYTGLVFLPPVLRLAVAGAILLIVWVAVAIRVARERPRPAPAPPDAPAIELHAPQ